MKRLAAMIFAAVLALLCLSACGESNSQVPDSQIEADLTTIMSEDGNLSRAYSDCNGLDHWEASHNVDESAHLDTVTLNLYFDTNSWLGIKEYSMVCVYQYSRDSDLWTLVRRDKAEHLGYSYVDSEFDRIRGQSYYGSDDEGKKTWYEWTVTVEEVDTAAETITLTYDITHYYNDGEDSLNWCDTDTFEFRAYYELDDRPYACIYTDVPFGYTSTTYDGETAEYDCELSISFDYYDYEVDGGVTEERVW